MLNPLTIHKPFSFVGKGFFISKKWLTFLRAFGCAKTTLSFFRVDLTQNGWFFKVYNLDMENIKIIALKNVKLSTKFSKALTLKNVNIFQEPSLSKGN